MRYLCIDLGDKRTGLAISDSITRIVSPLDVLEVPIADRQGDVLLDSLCAAILANFSPASPLEIVFGLPLNMADSTEGPRAKLVRDFAARLQARLASAPRPPAIRFHDERLSSVQADWQMAQSGLTHKQKKTRRDALAAAAILHDYLTTLPTASPPPAP